MKTLQDSGEYTVKNTGEAIGYQYSYTVATEQDVEDGTLTVADLLKSRNRMEKVDCNNTAREKAKSDNGHSTRPVLTEEQKLENKEKRAQDRALLDKIKTLSPAQRQALGL